MKTCVWGRVSAGAFRGYGIAAAARGHGCVWLLD